MKSIFICKLSCACTCDWLKACNTKHQKREQTQCFFTFDSDITRSCHTVTGQSIVACVLCNQLFNDQFMNESLLYHFIFGSFKNFHTVLQHEKQCIIKSSSKIQNRIEHEYFMDYFNAMRKSISQTGKNINQRVQLRTIVQTVNSQWLSRILQFILQTNDVYLQIYKLTITHALNYNILFAHAFEFTLDTISTNQHETRI